MCGRIRLAKDYSELKIKLRFDPDWPAPNLPPRWNIPPTTPVLTAVSENGKRIPRVARWGLLPRYEPEPKTKLSTHNARIETLMTSRLFAPVWARGQRCLVIADGFYEWRESDKQPFAIAARDEGPLAFAGLWDVWEGKAERVMSCTMIVMPSAEFLGAIHDRTPIVLPEAAWPKWLGETAAKDDELKAMLKPPGDDMLKMWPISKRVNSVRNDGADLADPIAI